MTKRTYTALYFFLDLLAASLAWLLFFYFRTYILENKSTDLVLDDINFYKGLVVVPMFWVSTYWFFGMYRDVLRKSRLKEFSKVLFVSILGVLVIFFLLLLDDEVSSYYVRYKSIGFLFAVHFGITSLFRMLLSTHVAKLIKQRNLGFNTLIIGSDERAANLYNEIQNTKFGEGYDIKGYCTVNGDGQVLSNKLSNLGKSINIANITKDNAIEEVLIAIESSEHNKLNQIIDRLSGTGVIIKIIPDMYDILSGSVRMSNIFGTLLIQVSPFTMPEWQKSIKRLLDIVFSTLVLILGFPLFFLIGLLVKFGSKGPIFFTQERIGQGGLPFNIIKFRTMYVGAEKMGPQLSKDNDPRITKIGRFLRKSRLDEIPQFVNVLKDEMTLVGPRPERQYFIDKITERAQHYKRLHRVKPGITSWGQVKYGYAENVDEMLERMKFDLLYIENMSLMLDFKILIYTVLIVLQGRGK